MPGSSDARTRREHAWRGYGLAALAAACWATGGLTAKWLFTPEGAQTVAWRVAPLGITVDPVVLSGARAFSAFAVLLVYLLVSRRYAFNVDRRHLPFLAVFGVVGLAGVHFTYFKAISYTNVATAILLEYLAPVIVLIFSVLFLGQRLTWTLPTGVALSVLGCALVVGAIGGDGLAVSPEGIAWGLASAVFFAAYSLMGRYAAPRFSPWTTLVFGLGFASVFWLIYLGGPGGAAEAFATPVSTAAVLFIAIASTIIPFAAFLKALHYIDPTRATIVATLEPVIAGVAAFAVFGETFGAVQLLGALLVLCAIVVIQAPGIAEPAQPFEVPPAT
jgi:drug/metabolite transporter (DMT)-like permease